MSNVDEVVSSNIKLIGQLWHQVPDRGKLKILLILPLMIVSSFAELVSLAIFPVFLGVLISPENAYEFHFLTNVFEWFSISDVSDVILFFTILFCGSVVASGVFRVVLITLNTMVFVQIGNDLSLRMFNIVINKNYSFFLKTNSSEIHALMYKTNALSGNALEPCVNIIISIVTGTFILGGLIYIEPEITILSMIVLVCIYGSIIYFVRKFVALNSYIIATHRGPLTKIIQESLGGIKDVIFGGTQDLYTKLYGKQLIPIQISEGKNKVFSATPRVIIETIGLVVLSMIAYLSHSKGQDKFELVVPIIAAVALGFHKLIPLVQQVYSCILIINGSKRSIVDCLQVFNSNNNDVQFPDEHTSIGKEISSLEVKKISFRYCTDSKLVLNKVSFSTKSREIIGFFGDSGCGKSTLLDIIMSLLPPESGGILVNDTLITNRNIRQWHTKISHVPQSIFLMDATVSENIALGVAYENIDYKKLERVIEMAALKDTIQKLPNGLETTLGERGVNLSGGQCQRIGIARALYRDTSILILDEATSALDDRTEKKIIENIKNIEKDLIIFMVTHRLNTLKNCNKIFQLREGHLIEHKFEQLMGLKL